MGLTSSKINFRIQGTKYLSAPKHVIPPYAHESGDFANVSTVEALLSPKGLT